MHVMAQMGVESVDELFVSRRDNQPFVVFFGKDIIHHEGVDIIGYEQTGVNGVRVVGFRGGYVRMWDDQQVAALEK